MADVVRALGRVGKRFAEKHLGWNRKTIRKGIQDRESGQPIDDRFHERGRRKAEEHLPWLPEDVREIVEPRSQTDPTFCSTRVHTPLTAEEVRHRLHTQFGYSGAHLHCARTLRSTLNELGYRLGKFRKCRPQKKIPDTDAISEEVHEVNEAADEQDKTVRISLDIKGTVKVGPFSRGGYSRQGEKASDHDFQPETSLTPFGVLLPQTGESHLWFTEGKGSADFMVDRIEEMVRR